MNPLPAHPAKPLPAVISTRRLANLVNHAMNTRRNRQAKAAQLARRRIVCGSKYVATLTRGEQAIYLNGGKSAVEAHRKGQS